MLLKVQKGLPLQGRTLLPASKSHSIRGVMLGLLAKGTSRMVNLLNATDMEAAIQACEALGAEITLMDNHLVMNSQGTPLKVRTHHLHTGNSGVTTHLALPLAGLRADPDIPLRIDCHDQMRERPIQAFTKTLTALGLTLRPLKKTDRLPFAVTGTLQGGTAEVAGFTSQYLSALLMALPAAEKDSVLSVTCLQERPYLEMTLQWLKQLGIQYQHEHKNQTDIFHIPGRQHYRAFERTIPGDFSSASCLLAAAVLAGDSVSLQGLEMQDVQGDKRLVSLLRAMGADITQSPDGLEIRGGRSLQGIDIDASDIPDLLPALAVIGTQAIGKTEIRHVAHARIKETDRIHSMAQGLRQMGARLEVHADGLTVWQSPLQGARVDGYGDHRTVMALSVAGLCANGMTLIEQGESIGKTWPGYVSTMQQLGASMEILHEAAL